MTLSLPSWSNATFVASRDPSASPSGFSCVVRMKRWWPRIASTTACSSLVVVWGELIDQLRHPDPTLHRRIVFERQLRGPLQPELAGQGALQDGMRGLEAGEGLLPLPLVPEH